MGRYEYSSRPILEDTTRITIPDLKSWGLLHPGETRTLQINLLSGGKPDGTLYLRCALARPDLFCGENFLEIRYSVGGTPVVSRYIIEPQPCYYGGYRYYFRCKPCRKRVTALYLVGPVIRCRHCGRLRYQLCREHRGPFEFARRAETLRDRAAELKRTGHPRKAKRLRDKAELAERVFEKVVWRIGEK